MIDLNDHGLTLDLPMIALYILTVTLQLLIEPDCPAIEPTDGEKYDTNHIKLTYTKYKQYSQIRGTPVLCISDSRSATI